MFHTAGYKERAARLGESCSVENLIKVNFKKVTYDFCIFDALMEYFIQQSITKGQLG